MRLPGAKQITLESDACLLSVRHHQAVSNWIIQAASALPAQITYATPADAIELDDLSTFVQQKKTRSLA